VPVGTRRVSVVVTWSDYEAREIAMSTLVREDPA